MNGSRNATAANLEAVGYGRQCSTEKLWGARRGRRSAGKEGEPCYVQLDMREEGDGRLASVYKPDRRRELQVGAPFVPQNWLSRCMVVCLHAHCSAALRQWLGSMVACLRCTTHDWCAAMLQQAWHRTSSTAGGCACMQERGFIIVGSFGDQFSDLDGTSPAQASFKLPNPWYYIL